METEFLRVLVCPIQCAERERSHVVAEHVKFQKMNSSMIFVIYYQ